MSQIFTCRLKVYEYIEAKYKAQPEYLWKRFPNYAVFRHYENRKWFAILMDVKKSKLGDFKEDVVDILNVKLGDHLAVELLSQREGFFKGYHISRGNWLSVLLDGSVELDEILCLIDESYAVTAPKRKR